jgi:hypothetical protein
MPRECQRTHRRLDAVWPDVSKNFFMGSSLWILWIRHNCIAKN